MKKFQIHSQLCSQQGQILVKYLIEYDWSYQILSDEFALFKSEEEAELAYKEAFGSSEIEEYYG